jgi:hypothetical protein
MVEETFVTKSNQVVGVDRLNVGADSVDPVVDDIGVARGRGR